MRVLTLDAAATGCSAGLVQDGTVLAERLDPLGQASALPGLVATVLAQAGPEIGLIAVTIGPGSFTGLRAALALAHGLGLARGVRVVGVAVGDALRAVAPTARPVWAAIDTYRGRLFLDRAGEIETMAPGEIPQPSEPVAVVGGAAVVAASVLAARGCDVQLLALRRPGVAGIARAALANPHRAPLPLYVDPPEARPGPAGRPAPA